MKYYVIIEVLAGVREKDTAIVMASVVIDLHIKIKVR